LVKREDPRGKPYYWIGGEPPTGVAESGTDFGDLSAGYVSITPIQLDLTAYQVLKEVADWNWPKV
jgi:5'-nucleotidase